jgi:hypothetical protein
MLGLSSMPKTVRWFRVITIALTLTMHGNTDIALAHREDNISIRNSYSGL